MILIIISQSQNTDLDWSIVELQNLLKEAQKKKKTEVKEVKNTESKKRKGGCHSTSEKLVSILLPAYNFSPSLRADNDSK